MSGHEANPIFFNKNNIEIRRPEHSLIPHPPTSGYISFLPRPPTPFKVDVMYVSPNRKTVKRLR